MKRLSVTVAGIALMLMIASGGAAVHAQAQAAAADPLKFSAAQPTILGWQVRADKTKDWEDFWAGLKTLCASSESAEIKAFGNSLGKMYKVDQAFDMQGTPTVLYLFFLDPPSTTFSYNPVPILYTDAAGFNAGKEGSKLSSADATALFDKFKGAFHSVGVIWKTNKIGG